MPRKEFASHWWKNGIVKNHLGGGEAACNYERCFLSSLENLVRAIVSSLFNIISSSCFHCYFRFLTFSYRFKFSVTVTYPSISIHFFNLDVLTLIFCQVFHK